MPSVNDIDICCSQGSRIFKTSILQKCESRYGAFIKIQSTSKILNLWFHLLEEYFRIVVKFKQNI